MTTGQAPRERTDHPDRPDRRPVLVLPPRLTASARTLSAAAVRRGLRTVEPGGTRIPQALRESAYGIAHLHAGPGFADAVAPVFGIAPLEAPADWLAGLPMRFTRREIRAMPIREAYGLRRPVFVKSPNDKSIPALVYTDGSRLPGPDAVEPETPVLVSEVLSYVSEYRLYVLDGSVHTASRYAERGRLLLAEPSPDALAFGADLLAATADSLPSAIVVDVGQDADGDWSVIEANAAWASGRYAADPERALDVVLRAAGPVAALDAARDGAFVRSGARLPREPRVSAAPPGKGCQG
ncbi:ATP-grasp domain-containing protein [Streptomyces sp. NBC_00102]|uniref:ATP-grasp domain-containing protein n=1 Tax=Streptomyces sp. NBC_00102 TaxID=2975652 RepID=UPI00224D2544|nr:ATP-grasp domain-containing protein [Streptomyces sp. NBC_00102]MCX5398955.1 ATP-grasp domain-containing protein [Streptomyces sp. NBC_00102]